MTKIGIVFMPRSAGLSVEVARAAEEGGFWGLGICDSPLLYAEMYPVISSCLLNTERIVVGPNVTNPVSRHWTVHAAAARTYEEMAPGRYFLGIASGDGAVHSVGLKPAKVAALEEAASAVRANAPGSLPIQVASGGPKTAEAAGRSGTGMIVGTGLDPVAIDGLRGRAHRARAAASGASGFEVWGLALLNVVPTTDEVEAARREVLPVAIAYARHAFDFTFEGKNVPDQYRPVMQERLPRYDFSRHALIGQANRNADIFADHPEIERYILDRFALVGTPDQCAERLAQVVSATGLDGIWFPATTVDPVRNVRLAARAFGSLMS